MFGLLLILIAIIGLAIIFPPIILVYLLFIGLALSGFFND